MFGFSISTISVQHCCNISGVSVVNAPPLLVLALRDWHLVTGNIRGVCLGIGARIRVSVICNISVLQLSCSCPAVVLQLSCSCPVVVLRLS